MNQKRFFQIPILIDCDFDEAKEKIGVISRNAIILKKDEDLIIAAREVLKRTCQQKTYDSVLKIGIYSKMGVPDYEEEDFTFDYYRLLKIEGEKDEDVWQMIVDGLKDFYEILPCCVPIKTFNIKPKCHISIATFFGYIFREVTDYRLIVNQGQSEMGFLVKLLIQK